MLPGNRFDSDGPPPQRPIPRVHAVSKGSGNAGAYSWEYSASMTPVQGFKYETLTIDSLEQALSVERLDGYIARCKGDRLAGIRLYERNTYLSEALYGVLQALEIALRNKIHARL